MFLICSFICAVFLCLFFSSSFFFKVIVFEFSFSQTSRKFEFFLEEGWILSSFWFLPSWGWSSGLCQLHIRWDLCWFCLLVCFSSDGRGWVRWQSCLLMTGFVFLLYFLFRGVCHKSAVSLLALNVSPLTQTIAPLWGSDPCFSSPSAEGRSSPTNTPGFFSRSSFVLPSFAWFCIIFSTGQLPVSALN